MNERRFTLCLIIISLAVPVLSQDVTLSSSLTDNGFVTACENEEIVFKCSTNRTTIVTWRSPIFIGPNINDIIQFNVIRPLQEPGYGDKSRLTETFAQLIVDNDPQVITELRTVALPGVPSASVTCVNEELNQNASLFYTLAGDVIPPNVAQPYLVCTNSSTNTSIYNVTWSLPSFSLSDLDHFEIAIDGDNRLNIEGSAVHALVSLSHGSHVIQLYAVDRCEQRSRSSPIIVNVTAEGSVSMSTSKTLCFDLVYLIVGVIFIIIDLGLLVHRLVYFYLKYKCGCLTGNHVINILLTVFTASCMLATVIVWILLIVGRCDDVMNVLLLILPALAAVVELTGLLLLLYLSPPNGVNDLNEDAEMQEKARH